MTQAIAQFIGEFRFLSNFYPAVVLLDGVEYPTVEHAYQAAKTFDLEWRAEIRSAHRPGEAKRLGQKVSMRDDWNSVRLVVMLDLLRQKFFLHDDLAALLLETGERELIEGNYWGDKFWGVCNGEGQNRLGLALMQVRDELRRR
jgi:N-glycosidase YbiA